MSTDSSMAPIRVYRHYLYSGGYFCERERERESERERERERERKREREREQQGNVSPFIKKSDTKSDSIFKVYKIFTS